MKSADESAKVYLERRVLLLLLLLVSVSLAFGWILWPFYGTILWASIIALLFAPVHRRLLLHVSGRRTPAALLTLLIALFVAILPFALVAAALAQATQLIATQAFAIGQNTFEFLAALFITHYLAFFLIRDGDDVVLTMRRAIPLPREQMQELVDKFITVIRATVKGNLLVAAIQGALGGLAFWFLGVAGALLWAVVMAFLSLLPAIGAALVWLPVAAYLLLTGSMWQGIGLIAYGMLVIGLVDNLLRPLLVGNDTRMPDYLVMMTTFGGMAVFGINGFVLGPAIAAMFIAVWHIYGTTRPGAAP
jgi:predicted PurR-regulated permease PerM